MILFWSLVLLWWLETLWWAGNSGDRNSREDNESRRDSSRDYTSFTRLSEYITRTSPTKCMCRHLPLSLSLHVMIQVESHMLLLRVSHWLALGLARALVHKTLKLDIIIHLKIKTQTLEMIRFHRICVLVIGIKINMRWYLVIKRFVWHALKFTLGFYTYRIVRTYID